MKRISLCKEPASYAELMLMDEEYLPAILGLPRGAAVPIEDIPSEDPPAYTLVTLCCHGALCGHGLSLVRYVRFTGKAGPRLAGKCFIDRLYRARATVADNKVVRVSTGEIRHADWKMVDYLEHPGRLSNARWAKLYVDFRAEIDRFRDTVTESVALCNMRGKPVSARAWHLLKRALKYPAYPYYAAHRIDVLLRKEAKLDEGKTLRQIWNQETEEHT